MNFSFIRLFTLANKESARFLKVWTQTILSPVSLALLYFLVFGAALSSRVGEINGVPYLLYIIPGLALLQSTSSAFSNPSSSLIIAKYSGAISDLLLPNLTALEKTIGFLLGGVFRGMLVAFVIIVIGILTQDMFLPQHPLELLFILFLSNTFFTLLGTLIGIWAKSFDQMQGFLTFIVTPMGFLGGAFYSIGMLPDIAAKISLANPFLYMVDSAKWAYFGGNDLHPLLSITVMGVLTLILLVLNYAAFASGWKMQD